MAALDISRLEESLAAPLHPLYVIHGEEDLLRVEALDALRAAAKAQGYLNREVYTADSGFDWQELLASAGSMGLFADLKLIEVHIPNGKPGKPGGEALERLAADLPPDTVLLVMLPKLERAQLQSKWFTALAKAGTVAEAKPVAGNALPAWLRGRLQQAGLAIENEALALFAAKVEGNLLAAKQEVDKLALLYPAGHLLTAEETERTVADVARFDAFQLTEAWMSGEAERVLRLLEGLQAEGEEPVLLLWSVAEDVRTLIRLAAAFKQGQTVAQVRNSLRLWGSKQQLAPQAVRRIAPARLVAALQQCAAIDRMIKGAEDGDAWSAMRTLLVELAA
ncbi:DNA polymerase III subunit delta [Neisseria shayeganii]|uniref:DNA polymerase III subunit delta n=1 Tax=Neisseria shayeganii 871 TaxID=1032488 RepID=G4CGY7_9NEIS|nr:DNA polymerase III subunit delta [Neisseria shayeganii]EGY52930.1 DNA-directed DNA polymerase III delta subunit [Neisseria shayeganii 871]